MPKLGLVQSIRWSGIKRFGQEGISILTLLVMVRLLAPEHFGLLAMAVVFTGISGVLSELGTGDAIIRGETPKQKFLSSVFWLNVAISAVASGSLYIFAPLIGQIYAEPIITPVVRLLIIDVALSGISRVYQALLERSMDFKAIATAQLVAQLTGAATGITLALLGFEVWSLVFSILAAKTIYCFLILRSCCWIPSFHFSISDIKPIFRFSAFVSLTRLLDHLQRQSVNLIIGAYIGKAALGVYSQSHKLFKKPTKLFIGFLTPVLFPSMSKLVRQGQFKKLSERFLDLTQAVALFYTPISIGLLLFSDLVVSVLLGENWTEMVPLISILGPLLLISSMNRCNVTLLKAMGEVRKIFFAYFLYATLSIVLSFSVKDFGLVAIAGAVVISTLMMYLLTTMVVLLKSEVSFTPYVQSISRVMGYGGGMLVVGFGVRELLTVTFAGSPLTAGALSALACVFVYAGAVVLRPVNAWFQMIEVVTGTKDRRSNSDEF